MRQRRSRRRGALAFEYAMVLPVFFFLLLASVVGGMGVFRYNELTWLAREGARWASVHGGQYNQDTGQAAATSAQVYQSVILPQAALLDPTQLTYAVAWDDPGEMPSYLDANNVVHTNRVRVTLTYQWIPEMYVGGMTLSTTSEMEVCN